MIDSLIETSLSLFYVFKDISSEDSLVKELRMTYDKVVEGEGTPLIGAKSIVTSSIHFYRNIGEVDIPVCNSIRHSFLGKRSL